jgi:L-glutamine-phosphate cytidylyltransferase
MRGIILAAGRGARLTATNGEMPKCLVTLGGETMLARNIQLLRRAGVDDIVVVIGCAADTVRRTCTAVTFVENARFAQTNSLYSLWLARPLLTEGFVVMNCDVLVHPQLLHDLLSARHENALLLDYRDETTTYGDEEMKVCVRCGRVVDISKTIRPDMADGENVGIAKFGPTGARRLIDEIDALIAGGSHNAWVPRAFKAFAQKQPLHVVGTRGLPWIEIDFPEDYRRAVEVVLPQIDGDLSSVPTASPIVARVVARPA